MHRTAVSEKVTFKVPRQLLTAFLLLGTALSLSGAAGLSVNERG
jgi:hypothetical protein